MKVPPRPAARFARLFPFVIALASGFLLPTKAIAAFGLTNSGGYYTVDVGANLVFKIQQSTGDLTSVKYQGAEYQSQSSTGHLGSGFGGSASVSATISGDYVKVTCNGTIGGDAATQYYIAKRGVDTIYLVTYAGSAPIGELRWITNITSPATTLDPGMAARTPSSGATVIESGDVYAESDGTTRSKYYGAQMAKDLLVHGRSGGGVGVYMAYGSRESSGGGPFYRDIQSGKGTVYNYMYSQHHQTDEPKVSVLHGPYALLFTTGAKPAAPDMSFVSTLGLTGYVASSGRGRVVLNGINGMSGADTYLVAYSNATAQYWVTASSTGGGCTCTNMKPGSYDMTIYKGQLAVYEASGITVNAGSATTLSSRTITDDPASDSALWRIGKWDGTPLEFKYGTQTIDGIPYINYMHPSDVRMNWSPATYTVGSSATNVFPAYQWQDINNPTTIKFNLSSSQLAARTVRIGVTDAYAGGRPKITVNGWTSSLPGSTAQPDGRSLTIGTYRGSNKPFTYNVPASAFVAGTNTLTITVISGSGASDYLSAGVSFDCVDLE